MHDSKGAEFNSARLPQDTPTDNIIYGAGTRLNPIFTPKTSIISMKL